VDNKVEDFKLTKEQKDFAQNYRKVKRISKVLQGKTMQKMQELQGLNALLRKTTDGMMYMLENAPDEDKTPNGMSSRG